MSIATAKPARRPKAQTGRTKNAPKSAPTSEPVSAESEIEQSATTLQSLDTGKATVVEIPIHQIDRHKSNRTITAESVDELRKSIETFGQLDPAHVRLKAGGRYELLSGERRFMACKGAKLKHLRCIVVSDDEAEAMIRLAASNSNRKDLDPIERAKLMERLMLPTNRGGSGLSRLDAGRVVGLTSDSGCKNALRILKLPIEIQNMVRDGKLSERAARRLIPFADIPPVMKDVVDELKDPAGELAFELTIEDQFPWAIRRSLEDHTRPLDERGTSYRVGNSHRWNVKKAFAGDGGLPVIEMEINDEKWRFTTALAEWDKLQAEAEAKQETKRAGKAGTSGKSKGSAAAPTKPEKTDKQRAAEADERLSRWTRTVFIPAVIRSQAAWHRPNNFQMYLPSLMLMHSHSECMSILEATQRELGIKSDAELVDRWQEFLGLYWSLLLWPKSTAGKPSSRKLVNFESLPDLDYLERQASLKDIARVASWSNVSIAEWWSNAMGAGSDANYLAELWLHRNTTDQLGRIWRDSGIKDPTPAKRGEIAERLLELHCGTKPIPVPKMLASEWAKAVKG